jgi:hypothetical protein
MLKTNFYLAYRYEIPHIYESDVVLLDSEISAKKTKRNRFCQLYFIYFINVTYNMRRITYNL